MNEKLQYDLDNISAVLNAAKDLSIDYLACLNDSPAAIAQPVFTPVELQEEGLGALAAQQVFQQHFLHNIVASSGPRYWGFVTGGTTPASIAGDWLASVFDQNTQNTKGAGDVSAALEVETVQLLLQLFGLPPVFHGAFVTGATMSNFTGLAVARQWCGLQQGRDIAREGIGGNMKIYAATPHSSAIKSMSMLGLGSNNITLIPVLPGRECMDIDAFEALLNSNPGEPFILISSGGTVNTVDYDDMPRIAALKDKYRFWWHIDAAFGAFAALSPNYQHLLNGWERADSITIDFHKWLNVPYDSAIVLTRKEHAQLQVQTFQNSNAPYLGNPLENFNYLNYVPENSRRFRALPVWFSLLAYGKRGYADIIENNIILAQTLGKAIEASGYYALAAPVRLNTVCFTVAKEDNRAEKIAAVLNQLNIRGRVFMTPTVYKGIPCIRAALVNWRTTMQDVDIAVEELLAVAEY